MNNNIKRGVIIAVFAFLAVLFVSTIGSSLTGFGVLNKKPMLEDYPYPFLKNGGYNRVHIVMPDRYDTVTYRAMSKITNALKKDTSGLLVRQPQDVTISTSAALPKGDYNLIVIGNPCTNRLLGEILKAQTCSVEGLGLKEGEALIQLFNHRRTNTLVLAGDVEKAATVIANYRMYPLKGNKVIITGVGNSLKLRYFTDDKGPIFTPSPLAA